MDDGVLCLDDSVGNHIQQSWKQLFRLAGALDEFDLDRKVLTDFQNAGCMKMMVRPESRDASGPLTYDCVSCVGRRTGACCTARAPRAHARVTGH